MPTNEFLPFASAGGANVQTQAEYAAEAARLAGVIAGTAKSALANKSWRQSAAMSAMIGQFIVSIGGLDALDNADNATLLANFVASLAKTAAKGSLLSTQVFQTAGTFTYTPTAGTRYVDVEAQGAGGGAAGTPATNASETSAGAGGGSGAYARKIITSAFSGVTITVGAAGTGGAAAAVGGNGGASSFGALVSAAGGGGGSPAGPTGVANAYRAVGGAAGAAGVSGDINISGLAGAICAVISQVGIPMPRSVGMFSGGPGSGGESRSSPPSTAGQTGDVGRAGIVIVWEYA